MLEHLRYYPPVNVILHSYFEMKGYPDTIKQASDADLVSLFPAFNGVR